MKEYLAVIQAGGKGTRMLELTKDKIPKPMLMMGNKPMIQWQIEGLKEYGIKEFCIIIGHLGEKIVEYFKDGSELGVNISYVKENEPLGSAGALFYIKELLNGRDIILVFGDVMFCIDWKRLIHFHESNDSLSTLLVHPNGHPYDSDILIVNEKNQVIGIDSKNNKRNYWYDNLVNSGIYILKNSIVNSISGVKKVDLEKQIISPLLKSKKVYAYRTPEYVKDAGTVERFKKCENELLEKIWEKKCLLKKQKVVFLDRDGTINKFKGLISSDEQLELEDTAAEAIKLLNSSGYLVICVTNQPVVARGMCNITDVDYIHKKLQKLLGDKGAYLDDIVFCPHHPDKGYPEENPLYKVKCNCRKPSTGMIDSMVEKYNIDISNSWIIGDSTIDIQLGKNAGIKTILLKTGQAGQDLKYDVNPNYEADNLLSAVLKIKSEEQ